MPFEAPWNAVIQWLNITDDKDIDLISPNRKSFQKDVLLTCEDLFVPQIQDDAMEDCYFLSLILMRRR